MALFIASVWLLHLRPLGYGRTWLAAFALAAVGVIGAAFTPWPVFAIGLVMAGLAAFTVASNDRRARQ